MGVNEISELLGKTIILLNDCRSKAYTRKLLKDSGYSDSAIDTVYKYIAGLNLPE